MGYFYQAKGLEVYVCVVFNRLCSIWEGTREGEAVSPFKSMSQTARELEEEERSA